METFFAVVFGMVFGAILVFGIVKTQKPKTTTKTGNGGGSSTSFEVDNQEVKDQNNEIKQAE